MKEKASVYVKFGNPAIQDAMRSLIESHIPVSKIHIQVFSTFQEVLDVLKKGETADVIITNSSTTKDNIKAVDFAKEVKNISKDIHLMMYSQSFDPKDIALLGYDKVFDISEDPAEEIPNSIEEQLQLSD